MKILCIDTSTNCASCAIVSENEVIGEVSINNKITHSQKVMPAIEAMFKISGEDIKNMDYVAVCEGPGSFTGLRIGIALAKSIAQAVDIPVVGISALDIIAQNHCDRNGKTVSIIDAQRDQFYFNEYEFENGVMTDKKEDIVVHEPELVERLEKIVSESADGEVVLAGEGTKKAVKSVQNIEGVRISGINSNISRASSLGMIAIESIEKNENIFNCYEIKPKYIRKSQAEIEYEKKHKK